MSALDVSVQAVGRAPARPGRAARPRAHRAGGELPSPAEETPELLDRRSDGHLVACHLVADDGEPPRVTGSATAA